MNNRINHTPATWTAKQGDDRIAIYGTTFAERRNVLVAVVNQDDSTTAEEDRANAALIAASPNLLVACETSALRLRRTVASTEIEGGSITIAPSDLLAIAKLLEDAARLVEREIK